MEIENVVRGVSVRCVDEGLDNKKYPAKVIITDPDGKTFAVCDC